MNLEQYLAAMDIQAEICDGASALVRLHRAQHEEARSLGVPEEDTSFLLTQTLLAEFDALYGRYLSFWPKSAKEDAAMRHFRPQWPYFSDRDFEHLVASAIFLAEERFYRVTAATRDGGYDLIYEEEMVFREGLRGTYKVMVQCKLLRDTIALSDVRDFVGTAYAHNASGVLISNAALSPEGRKFLTLSNHGLRGQTLTSVTGDAFNDFLKGCEKVRSQWQDLLCALDAADMTEAEAAQARIDAAKESVAQFLQGAAR